MKQKVKVGDIYKAAIFTYYKIIEVGKDTVTYQPFSSQGESSTRTESLEVFQEKIANKKITKC